MKATHIALLALIVCLVAFGAFTALRGVDFGFHWDEEHTLGLVQHYVRTQEFLPGWYEWPPMLSYMAYSATIPYSLPLALADYPGYHIREYVVDLVLQNPTFTLNARKLLVAVTFLSPLWLLLGVWRHERHLAQAGLAAVLLALSWELNYHARWIAPDALMMQFGALVLMCCLLALSAKRYPFLWLSLGAAAAACAAASKYPGALLLLAVLAAAYWHTAHHGRPTWRFVGYAAALGLICALTFVLVVPGVFAESEQFWATIRSQIAHYAGGHGRQTVTPGLSHLWLMLTYLSAVFFSPHMPVALAVTALALVAVIDLVRQRQWAVLSVLLLFPVAYLLLFSRQSVLFVRNILVVTPFLAVLAASGAHAVYRWLPTGAARVTAAVVLAAVLTLNAYSLWANSQSIVMRNTSAPAQAFIAYATKHPEQSIFISPQVQHYLQAAGISELPANLTPQLAGADQIAAMFYEAMEIPGYWWVNRPGAAPLSFGPHEVNLDYYAFWRGDDRILLATPEHARQLGFKAEFIP